MSTLTLALLSLLWAPIGSQAPQTVHITSIELSADGVGGTIHTQAVQLGGGEAVLGFGEGACRKYRIGDRVLAQLFSAMEAHRELAFDTEPAGDHRCVRRVRFTAP